MEQTKYRPTPPPEVFAVRVERAVKHLSRHKIVYEYSYSVELRPSGCRLVDQFAELVRASGKCRAEVFAARLGVDAKALSTTLKTLTGAGTGDWCDAHACAVGEALLSGTDWPVERVARAAKFNSHAIFSRFWLRKYRCPPGEWRRRR